MLDLVLAAFKLQKGLDDLGLPNCVIGGLALQAWGELRLTRDADFTVLTRFLDEESKVRAILGLVATRVADPVEFALANRVVVGTVDGSIPVDIGLGGFEYEEQVVERGIECELAPGVRLRICTAEDLVVMKTFAGRDQDWIDIEGIIARQPSLNWAQIQLDLAPLLETIEDPGRLDKLLRHRSQ